MSLRINGSADVTLNQVASTTLMLQSNGSVRLSGQGTVESLEIEINGSGSYAARDLTAHSAMIAIAGSGDIEVHATHSLAVTIRGAGKVAYWGNPTVEHGIQGAGSVSKAE